LDRFSGLGLTIPPVQFSGATSIFQKIGVPNRLAAALWALRVTRQDEAQVAEEDLDFVKVPVSSGRRAADGTVTLH
jgi:hypothetical protein